MQDHLKPLTSLRFFAAFWVVLYTYIHELAGAPVMGIVDKGYLGVDLFFVLSGFILSYCYLDGFGEGRFSYGQFTVHRLARVYPLHIATLAFTLLLIAVAALKGVQLDANAGNWAALPAHLTLTQAWGLAPTPSFNHPSWSISAEWFAYLSFPAVAFIAWRLRDRPIVAVSLAIALLVAINVAFAAFAGFNLTRATFQWGALRIIPSFLYGSALYLAWRSGAVANRTVAVAGTLIALAAVAGAATFGQSDILMVVALGLLVLSVSGLNQNGVMSNRVLVYLGEISFATYMIYVPWKWVYLKAANAVLGTEHQPLPLFWWAVGLVALVPLSMLAHHLIERPFRKIVRFHGERLHNSITYLWAK
ncbi:acyltransferase [Asticcacaulis sp. 201]|uniref:acyltransferase family protein n=1 Tax=Asticcacaulis sp. 201 TaxID=3028787 RepID=UPI002916DD6B|nr:acyltransferase [Asticcacaulis sp. 201]MDV6332445.1 acyltransferase [Asticcacaulis sp. 201]